MRLVSSPPTLLLLCLLLSAAGCQPGTSPTAQTPQPAETTSSGQGRGASPGDSDLREQAADVRVEVQSWAEVEQRIAEHRGRVVVVDIWSTWCVPCLREFPHLVQLQKAYGSRVACLSVNIDYIGLEDEPPESLRDKVLEFLRSQQAIFQNVISSDPDETVLTTVGVSSIPAVLVYDRQGQLGKKFTNDDQEYGEEGFSYQQHILPLVDQLLAE